MVDQHYLASSTFPRLPYDLLDALRQPFAPHDVRLRVGKRRRRDEAWECTAVPVLSRQAIETRFDTLVPGGWSTSSPSLVVAHDRMTVSVQVSIGPIAHTDYGEVSLSCSTVPNEVEEFLWSVPEAFEHAFIRACARFGAGRYLSNFAREWVPYDAERGCIALSSQQQQAHILKLYQQADIPIQSNPDQFMTSASEEPLQPPAPGYPGTEVQPQGVPDSSPLSTVARERIRAQDIAWVQQQCASHPNSLQRILRRWHVPYLEDLSDAQLTDIVKSIRQSHTRSAQTLPYTS